MELVEIRNDLGGLPLLQSRLLGRFVHGFTTRAGGVSQAPYASLNMGMGWGDARESVLENRRRVAAACGAAGLCLVRQVHGAQVLRITADTTADQLAAAKVDALCTDGSGIALGIFTADCVPLLVADPVTGAVAAIHAGWRGVIAGVAPAALAAMSSGFASRTADLRVALGPAIGPCCFEVGDEVVAAFEAAFPGARPAGVIHVADSRRPGSKLHVDLKRALQIQLQAAGVAADHIDAGAECTMCDPAGRFYSYRRDNTQTGQHLAVIVARAPIASP